MKKLLVILLSLLPIFAFGHDISNKRICVFHYVYFMGNSLTDADIYPETIDDLLGSFWIKVNKGISGNTVAQMSARLQADIISAQPEPDVMVILAGTNDVSISKPASYIIDTLQSMYSRVSSAGIKVVALTITPRTGATARFNEVIDSVNTYILTEATDVYQVLDTYTLLEDPENPTDLLPAYDDNTVHLTTLGYTVLGTFVYENKTW